MIPITISLAGVDNLMNKPLEFYQHQVGNGWSSLVEKCYTACQEHGVIILDVKEKWGMLRFYTANCPPPVHDVIAQAEEDSLDTCEACGEPGEIRSIGWMKTLCDTCLKQY
jgi:hypothetical protein